MEVVQAQLQSGTSLLTCWIEASKARPGNFITLKNYDSPKQLWEILSIGEPKEKSEIKQTWHNNI